MKIPLEHWILELEIGKKELREDGKEEKENGNWGADVSQSTLSLH